MKSFIVFFFLFLFPVCSRKHSIKLVEINVYVILRSEDVGGERGGNVCNITYTKQNHPRHLCQKDKDKKKNFFKGNSDKWMAEEIERF